MSNMIWNRGGYDPEAPDPEEQVNRIRSLLGVMLVWMLVLGGATVAAWMDRVLDVEDYATQLLATFFILFALWGAVFTRIRS